MKNHGSSKSGEVSGSEVRLFGNAVSRGTAVGRVVSLHGSNRQFFRVKLSASEVPNEIKRLRRAFDLSIKQLSRLALKENGRIGADIFSTHGAILEDPSFQSRIESRIEDERINAEWAVSLIADSYIAKYKAIPDEHLRERYIDLEDVVERLLNTFSKRKYGPNLRVTRDSIIAAEELRPSTLVELAEIGPLGCITEHGGWTSHTFILAREAGIPAVTGLPNLLRYINNGDTVIVDGYSGQVVINPTAETLADYAEKRSRLPIPAVKDFPVSEGPLKTLDGRRITIRVNADSAKNVRESRQFGADGIGLFRSEFLFNQFNGYPSENRQFEAYSAAADAAGSLKVRTFDLSAGQITELGHSRERNPALGLRAIRLSLAHRDQMAAQFRAILRAAAGRKIDVVLPMVGGLEEIRKAKEMLDCERTRLKKKGIEIGEPRVGAMIEVPSTIFLIDRILEEIDFLCLGTNDLVQYLLAVDRDNETVADWFRTLHPAVISAVSRVIDAAAAAGKPLVICGEMAGSPFYTPLLLGLGATDFSMNLHSLPHVAGIISGIAYEESRDLARQITVCRTADEIESVAANFYQTHWSHLFPRDMLRKM